ncbi:SDR family NAD(P)-dependent oxidoreductase [Filimonas effusa]|uniref:SDR family NAD(P)-dependent oxidoreductase n=1 Tax=Filimonas effusa TaxID=2508721 RepID=A0A4Q1DBL3_9BACT|nr:SDR family NAD(P)-dependent oxidoreductase [Filimonas effusa]RXK86175.1 SDR family NAD(P)-dependent oxidoreductase [Filimonas effusa]
MSSKVWYVTGASKGLGLALVQKLLAAGHKVVATSRSLSALTKAVGIDASSQFLPVATDLGNEQSVEASIRAAVDTFGRIDVVVNNAGYGIGGTIEELSQEEIRQSFEVNVFGTMTVAQKAMPYLRAQRSGHLINISSIAGFAGATGWAVYAAAKQAVIGFSEVLAQDVKEFGIKVTVVAPGAFRTQFLTSDSLVLAAHQIKDYTEVSASHARYRSMDGKQTGDPDKAAAVFMELAALPEPPVVLFLGEDAWSRATAKIATLQEGLNNWKALTCSTQLTV